MAAAPNIQNARIQLSKSDITKAKVEMKADKYSKTNTIVRDLTLNALPDNLQPTKVLPKQAGKKAPKRITEADVKTDKIAFWNYYGWVQSPVIDENGDTVNYVMAFEPDERFYCGEGINIYDADPDEDGVDETYVSQLGYFGEIPIVLDMDNMTATFAVSDGYNVGMEVMDEIDTVQQGRYYYFYIYAYVMWLWPEDYMAGETEELVDIVGQIDTDGSIYFDQAMMYYYGIYRCIYRSTSLYSQPTLYQDWTRYQGMYASPSMRDMMFITPNGQHEYTSDYDGEMTNNVLMYQVADTVAVWNLYDLGMWGNYMVLSSDYTMEFPAQYVYDWYDSYDYETEDGTIDIGGDFVNLYADVVDDEWENVEMGNTGTYNENEIVWTNTLLYNGNVDWDYYPANKLTYTDGSQFVVPAPPVTILLGDVNEDGEIDITDVTLLINAVLTGNLDDINVDNADCDESGSIDITDVTKLISRVLTGAW